jgi:predicted short-subunit dehydrogenase-like oxidoreductase (DUF2520 family)
LKPEAGISVRELDSIAIVGAGRLGTALTAALRAAGYVVLGPLVRAAVEDWAALGAERALTGPIARGDEETVERQRAAVAERTPDLLPLFDVLVDATRAVAL